MLTRISTWKNGKWEHISAEEAAALFPYTVPVGQKRFICELCGQYVSLTGPGKVVRHFKHSRGDDDKNCEERSSYYAITPFADSEKDLPIRISVSDNSCYFSIGLPIVSEKVLDRFNSDTITVYYGMGKREYSLERLSSYKVTYLSVGNRLCEKYSLSFSNEELMRELNWPLCATGYSGNGRLFDKKTGSLLPFDCDVTVGTTYYYVTKRWLLNSNNPSVRKIMALSDGCHLYELVPTRLDEINARFFLDLKARLTNTPVKTNILWPPSRILDQISLHNNKAAILMVFGDAKTSKGDRVIEPIQRENDWSLYRVSFDETRCSVLTGRTKLLNYWEFMHSDDVEVFDSPEVELFDEDGELLDQTNSSTPPKHNLICVKAAYDGHAFILQKNGVWSRVELPAEQNVTLHGIEEGSEVSVYIGDTLVREIKYLRNDDFAPAKAEIYTSLIKAKGRRVPISLAVLGAFAKAYPDKKIHAWLRRLDGMVPEDALKVIRTNMLNKEKQDGGD